MESLNPEFALFGSKNECARTDTVFFPLSEVITWVVTLYGNVKGGLIRGLNLKKNNGLFKEKRR